MNYNYSKQYGELVNSISIHFLSSNDIYEGSALLPKIDEAHYLISRLAFNEIFLNYPSNQKVITFVIDNYILSDAVKEFFLTKLYQNTDLKLFFSHHLVYILNSISAQSHDSVPPAPG